jgi:hypothetical protein
VADWRGLPAQVCQTILLLGLMGAALWYLTTKVLLTYDPHRPFETLCLAQVPSVLPGLRISWEKPILSAHDAPIRRH